jgi:sn-glycerol 3-phosphate transport system substrate-binding protein
LLRAAAALACVAMLGGCTSAKAIRLAKVGPETACVEPIAEQDLVVGVALSGGGSRAALFSAGGLEALGRLPAPQGGSVLEQVSYISSVSGGGLASSYYAVHKPPRSVPMIGPDGAMTKEYEEFFGRFKKQLSQDFEGAIIRRQLGKFRFVLNSALAAQSLNEVLAERLLGRATFSDLVARERAGDSPRVIFNSALYNSGRRFLFSALPPDASQYDFVDDLERSLAEDGKALEVPEVVERRWELLLPVTPLDLQIDPCPVPISGAVTASASFPPLVGPITFQVGDEDYFWHTGDGGLYENLGLEALQFVFLKQLQDRRAKRALIISFNSSYPFQVGFRLLGKRSEPWTIWNYDFTRIPSIMEERATAYWSLFYRGLQLEGVFPDDATLGIVFLNHNGARWAEDLSDLPAACRRENPPLSSPEDVQDRIAEIPTRLNIESECDRQLLFTAAAKVVEQNRREIEIFLAEAQGLTLAPQRVTAPVALAQASAPTAEGAQTPGAAPGTLEAAAPAPAAAGKRTEILFWHAMDGERGEALAALVKRFNESQGEFEVKAVYKGNYDEVVNAAMTAYRQKEPPHLAQVFEIGTRSMILSRAIVPAYRLIDQAKIAIDWEDLLDQVFNYYSEDGKLYSMPLAVSTPILYYNKDAFAKAGLPDQPPATWAEVEDFSRRLLAAGAATCGFTTSWPEWSMLENTFAWHDQPYATNQNGFARIDNRLLLNSDFGRKHVGALAAWSRDGIFTYGGEQSKPDAKFVSGDCAMLIQSSGSIGEFKKSVGFAWGTGQLPHWGGSYPKANSIVGGSSLWALRGRPPGDYRGVAQFMKFISEPEQQIAWSGATGYLPFTKTAFQALEQGEFYDENPEHWTGLSQLRNAPPSPNSRGVRLGNLAQIRDVIRSELESVFSGKKEVKDALDSAVVRGNAILREFGITHKPWPDEI